MSDCRSQGGTKFHGDGDQTCHVPQRIEYLIYNVSSVKVGIFVLYVFLNNVSKMSKIIVGT